MSDKEKIFEENQKLISDNDNSQHNLFNLNNELEKIKLELDNMKLDKEDSEKTIENLRNFEESNKDLIMNLTNEKEEILAKNNELKNHKIELELKLTKYEKENSNNNNNLEDKEFICKFCKNRQHLNEPEFPIVNNCKEFFNFIFLILIIFYSFNFPLK